MSEAGEMSISKSRKILMRAKRYGSLYYMTADIQNGSTEEAFVLITESLKTWHSRLGHPALGTVKELIKRGLVRCDGGDDQTVQCEECILGKAKRMSFSKAIHTSTKPLDYAHSDLWGPAQTKSIGGGRYYMSLIDDYSKKIWLYVLKEKSEVFTKFKQWCAEVEAENGTSLGCLRTDNGLEYLSKEFDEFCKLRGIKRHKTVPLNPQQNGVAERANRTILERTRCMLIAAGLEKRFWAEAATTAVVLMNKCPTSSLNGDIPDNKWFGRQCRYEDLRIFGCRAFAHVKQGKLEPRATKCIMLGYQPGVKGYRLWCTEPGNGRIVISRDVVFWEHDLPFKRGPSEINSDNIARIIDHEDTGVEVENQKGQENITDTMTDALNNPSSPQQHQGTDMVDNWKLTRDRVKRNVKPSNKYSDAEYLFFCLIAAEEVEYSEPNNYEEAACSND